MISKPWRDRLLHLAMCVFVGWHSLAIIIAPAPEGSPPIEALRTLLRPYVTLFRLESTWAFFEHIPRSPQFRYVIDDEAGMQHTFIPVEDFKWYHPRYSWFERIYWAIMENPHLYADYFAEVFCRQHAELKPLAITMLMFMEEEFRPEDQLNGYKPLDPEFVTVTTLKTADCPETISRNE